MFKKNKNHRDPLKTSSNFPSQNMIISKRLIHDMIDLARIHPHETVLDIGAGAGALTFPLAEKAAKVLAIEIDSVLIHKLLDKMGERGNIEVKQCDFLETSLPSKPFVVVANIPYSITTPIFEKLLHPAVPMQRAVILVEKGAAKGFTSHSIRNPRILNWRMQYEIRLVRTVSPDHFAPPPKVDSAILSIRRREQPLVSPQHHQMFSALATYGLRDPKLPLYAALSEIFTPPQIARLVKLLRVDRELPMGQLNEEQWGTVFHTMLQHVPPYRRPQLRKDSRSKSKKRK